jgi:5-methylcytosine-specific restriction protein B
MDINDLLKKSQELHQLKTNKEYLFEVLNSLEKTSLTIVLEAWKPKVLFQPVVLLRFLIANLLYIDEKVNEETIVEIKKAIESRNISKYYDAPIEYSKNIVSYKNSKVGMFPQWKEPFIILFPFFYSQSEKEDTKSAISVIANEVVNELSLKEVRIHIVDFYGANNYGDDRVWFAIIPEKALNVQMAYQLFFSIYLNKIEGGLYCGHKVPENNYENKAKIFSNLEDYIKDAETLIPKWKELNRGLDFLIQKDEKDFRNRVKKTEIESLQFYFHYLDQLIEDLSIPDKDNLVFSTGSGQLSFQIGKRYCLNVKKNKFSFIAPDGYEVTGLEKGHFAEPDKANYFSSASAGQVESNYAGILQAVQNELDRDNHTQPKEYDNMVFRRAVFDKEYRQQFFNFETPRIINNEENKINKEIKMKFPLNQILYGAPGTGKTYKTKELAVEIITGKKIEDRAELTKVYEDLKENNQINFTTFHQSISYEDFVEGIKPKLNEEMSDEISYEIKNGIFKQICSLDSEDVLGSLFYVGRKFETWTVKKVTSESVHFGKPRGGILILPLPLFLNLYDLIDEYNIDFSSGKLQSDLEVDRIRYPFIERFYISGYETLHKYIFKEYQKLLMVTDFEPKKSVLIIDEINRGNVSAIFGELITLIEEDKRLGRPEALEVILPYSKTKFGVPDNLYIIGTMNTADRSVESLDTALRRRFSFVEMQPDLDVLKEEHISNGIISTNSGIVDMVKMLGKINKRIEILLNKDHKIGHSFFINTSNFEELQLVFKDKIIPLLEEYFFGDFGKIGLVLGESFIKNTNVDKKDIFAKFDDYEDRSLLSDKLVYDIKNPMHIGAEHFIAIYE